MYRCFGCDSPANLNCACYTQIERPEERTLTELGRLRAAEDNWKINIASGEDVIPFPLYAEEHA